MHRIALGSARTDIGPVPQRVVRTGRGTSTGSDIGPTPLT